HERRRHFSPIAKLQRALSQAASGDDPDRVGGAAVNLNKGHQPLAVFALRILDVETSQPEHGHTYAQHLAGAEMAVRLFGVVKILIGGLHAYSSWSASARSEAASTCRP